MSDLTGKVAIVTGASSGIGRKTAELFEKNGARVVTFARSAGTVTGDIADPEAVERLFAVTEERFGPCDVLVNCAGMIDPAPLVETSLERWRRMFAVNVDGIYLTCHRALPSMLARGAGAIVNVASISGVVGPEKFPGWVSYCASKGAVISLTEALAIEVKDRGVRVNAVSPGSVDTKMWEEASGGAPASMTAEEIAETILFLASDRSRPMNGQNLNVYSA
jgi:NAD(P)-dependent dehydrogenase (short-subunit alcohol dehydrogenase family)